MNCTDYNYGIMIRDLCFNKDSCDPHVLTIMNLFNSLNTYVRYKNILSNVHLTYLYVFVLM